ncbi:hypothetical protein HIM_05776 [Hirsutella minnesotensis 3608]|uniref:Uncharacterized protein n=1 Tax=Hirsutella minnesotensis 3608 TaxID=1043627 RepID=A0A0F7ZZX6_9HYPO|nr:hypothetical protein HIM_05776 [Hirsutella minnesotensis 3608]
MSSHRTKRPFAGASADPSQRQITSFFPAAEPTSSSSPASASPQAASFPVLPSSIQANLLSVGMRVRKSVPEGYKTDGTSAFKLWTDVATIPGRASAGSAAAARASARELLPFCGINKVGGLATQSGLAADEDDDVPDLDAVPELTLSQESVESNEPEPTRKRIFDDDDDDDGFIPTDDKASWSMSSKMWDTQSGNARIMAIPRSRVKKSTAAGQENVAMDEDFEEADFLVFGENRDMDLSR